MMKFFPVSLALLLVVPLMRADDLSVTALSENGTLVFKTPTTGKSNHHYRVESSTSPADAAWTTRRSVIGVGASASVTNLVASTAPILFYRVVSSSNSAEFVDGEYLVVDLSGGTNAASYPVTNHAGAAAIPGGLTNDAYKTDKLLMRKLAMGFFLRGSPTTELGRSGDEPRYAVTLTKDFYIGVFEVTQRQWELVMGNRPGYFTNAAAYAARPVERVSYNAIRENTDHTDDPAVDWPANSDVNTNSFMGRLRAKTGLATFDLPTEAQWEFACRAGTASALNTGHNLTNEQSDIRMDAAGRYYWNGGSSYSQNIGPTNGTAKVGSFLPNAWGLYDLHGNAGEWCLDWYGTYPGPEINPSGPASGTYRVVRTGGFAYVANGNRSASRLYNYPFVSANVHTGFRIAMTLP